MSEDSETQRPAFAYAHAQAHARKQRQVTNQPLAAAKNDQQTIIRIALYYEVHTQLLQTGPEGPAVVSWASLHRAGSKSDPSLGT